MKTLNNFIISLLIERNLINENMSEVYSFGLTGLFLKCIYYIILLMCGIILKMPIIVLVFCISYQTARAYFSGYHAKSKTKCFILSSLLIYVSLFLVKHYWSKFFLIETLIGMMLLLFTVMIIIKFICAILLKTISEIGNLYYFTSVTVAHICFLYLAAAFSLTDIIATMYSAYLLTLILYIVKVIEDLLTNNRITKFYKNIRFNSNVTDKSV